MGNRYSGTSDWVREILERRDFNDYLLEQYFELEKVFTQQWEANFPEKWQNLTKSLVVQALKSKQLFELLSLFYELWKSNEKQFIPRRVPSKDLLPS